MATAEKTTVERMVTEDGFTLKLTVDEAEALVAVMARVGGSPTASPRGRVEDVMKALQTAGVRPFWTSGHLGDLATGSINFNDFSAED